MFPWSLTHVNDSGFPVFERGKRAKHSTGYRGTGRPSGQLKDDRQVVKIGARRIGKDPRQRLRSRKLRSAQCPEHTLGSLRHHHAHRQRRRGQRHCPPSRDHDKESTVEGSRARSRARSTVHHQRSGRAYGTGERQGSTRAPRLTSSAASRRREGQRVPSPHVG